MKAYQARTTVMQGVAANTHSGIVCDGDTLADLTADYCRRNDLPIDRGGDIVSIAGVGGVRHHAMTIINRGNIKSSGWESKTVNILLPGDTGCPGVVAWEHHAADRKRLSV
jgi:hypothetical protein